MKKKRYFIRNAEMPWRWVEVPEEEALANPDIWGFEEDEDGMLYALYAEDFKF